MLDTVTIDSIQVAKDVIRTEIEGLAFMESRIGPEFDVAVKAILNTQGRIIICGMGKSGIIGKKIAASFASTGTPSFFMHPGEAFHGDLGMVKSEDIFIAISYSGETDEVIKLLPFLRENNNFIITVTGNSKSTLSLHSNCNLDIAVPNEACFLRLAPTSSTTAALVMGDALTVALMKGRNFQPENFARFHPGGSLGKKLLSKVCDLMITKDIPIISFDANFTDVVHNISLAKLGLCLVKLEDDSLGIITDGDLRRAMDSFGKDSFSLCAKDIATKSPSKIKAYCSVENAYRRMEKEGVSTLLVFNENEYLGIFRK